MWEQRPHCRRSSSKCCACASSQLDAVLRSHRAAQWRGRRRRATRMRRPASMQTFLSLVTDAERACSALHHRHRRRMGPLSEHLCLNTRLSGHECRSSRRPASERRQGYGKSVHFPTTRSWCAIC
jgi:hypothetical protein